MLRVGAVTALFLLVAVAAWGCGGRGRPASQQTPGLPGDPETTRPSMEGVVEAGNRFAFDLYAQLRGEEGNLFFSPYSLSAALSMTYAGAEGQTEKEMADILHVSAEEGKWHELCGTLREGLAGDAPGYELSVANRLWGQQGHQFLDSFLDITRDHYGAALGELNFARAPEEARLTINRWVADQTRDKIRDLLAPGTVDDSTRLVLTNAIYFKGMWLAQFDPKLTRDEPFQIGPEETVLVPMMHRKGRYRYAHLEDLKVLEMPYVGEQLSMVILLPRDVGELSGLEARLTSESLKGWLESVYEPEVRVALPRFSVTSKFELAEALIGMGMPSAFDPGSADFSGMTGKRDLFISAAIHEAYVDVNEEGTEAAAATGIVMGLTSAGPGHTFVADHPFVFLIRDGATGSILFVGRVMNPLA